MRKKVPFPATLFPPEDDGGSSANEVEGREPLPPEKGMHEKGMLVGVKPHALPVLQLETDGMKD